VKDRLIDLVVTSGGLGHMRPASGTWGSLPPAVAWIVLALAGVAPGGWTMTIVLIAIAVAASVGCVTFGRWSEQRYGKKDPGQVVADEVAGQAVALLWMPVLAIGVGPAWLDVVATGVIAFLAFRMFDIIKLPPANQLQALPHGWGILVDDLVAGVFANIGTRIGVLYVAPPVLRWLIGSEG
jgi:phosphatidylglycerophosphatase A